MSVVEVGPEGWVPGRGDYGSEYSSDLIEIIEAHNCIKGCAHSGTDHDREEFGPGGNCHTLAVVSMGDQETPIPELDPTPDGPICRRRQDPATAGMEPLFEVGG